MSKDEQLKLEHATLLEEYRALKSEIAANLDSARQVTNLTLAAIGALIAVTPTIVESQSFLLFLIAPLFFYGLAFTQLRYTYLVFDMGAHLRQAIVPRVQQILAALSPGQERDFSQIMSWELVGKSPMGLRGGRVRGILFLPVAGATYGIPLLAAVLSMCAFFIPVLQHPRPLMPVEIILAVVDIIALFYSAFWGIQAESSR